MTVERIQKKIKKIMSVDGRRVTDGADREVTRWMQGVQGQ